MRIGLYPGTFDPVTLGHVDIIQRAMALVDRLVIGVAINRDKGPLFVGSDDQIAGHRQFQATGQGQAIQCRNSGLGAHAQPFHHRANLVEKICHRVDRPRRTASVLKHALEVGPCKEGGLGRGQDDPF